MKTARLRCLLHAFGYWFSTRMTPCRMQTYSDHGRTIKVFCTCGKVFAEAQDSRAQLIIQTLDIFIHAGTRMDRNE